MSDIETVTTQPFPGQRPGTSGLRKRVADFMQPGYLENFVQAIFDAIDDAQGKTFVVGGDGRYFNREAIQTVIAIAAGNRVGRLLVARGGLLSTPAASCVIRKHAARGGIILSASHNPGGPDGDFGIKFNDANGGPASEQVTEAIHRHSAALHHFHTVRGAAVDIDRLGATQIVASRIEVFDPLADYVAMMQQLFDFPGITRWLTEGRFGICFDAMHAVTGPYARALLEGCLGAPAGSVINAKPLEDFGGGHPDPNLAHAGDLIARLREDPSLVLGAASDGDGDRNMILGNGCFINPCDSLAIMAAHAHHLPGYRHGLTGVARSMPTSRAVDRVAAALGVPVFETPTGWKYFGNLLDAGRINLCGEESFGTGSDHVREKDGLWAVLYWLNMLAVTGSTPWQLASAHWARFGRDYFSRHDYENLDAERSQGLVEGLRRQLPALAGSKVGSLLVKAADDFAYRDPVDGSESLGQGLRIDFGAAGRLVVRLSGTGTSGATLRLYFDRHEPPEGAHDWDPQVALAPLIAAAETLLDLVARTGRTQPDVIT